tara:strand:- start:2272 stop:2487 length:216 start_codon:yes stop_codon:yes gene_type:complete
MHTVENRASEVAEELLEKIRLLARDFVEPIALSTVLDVLGCETAAKLGVEDYMQSQYIRSQGNAQLACHGG